MYTHMYMYIYMYTHMYIIKDMTQLPYNMLSNNMVVTSFQSVSPVAILLMEDSLSLHR